jgi:hypothetical protein
MRKLMLLVAAGAGYVLGTRAGRERYEQIMGTVNKVRNDPRVQQKTQQAVDVAKQQAPAVADKVTGAAGSAKGRFGGSEPKTPEPSYMAGPQGDLP